MKSLLKILVVLTCLSFFFQLVIDQSFENIVSVVILLIGAVITFAYILSRDRYKKNPVSCFMLMMFNISSMSGALIVKTAYLSPVSESLNVPVFTFFVLGTVQLILVLSHYTYSNSRLLSHIRHGITEKFWVRFKIFSPVSEAQLWVMGLIGIVSIVISRGDSYASEELYDAASIPTKIAQGLTLFAYAPLALLSKESHYISGDLLKNTTSKLTVYFLLLIFAGMAVNTRTTFMFALLAGGAIVWIGLATDKIKVSYTKRNVELAFIFCILGILLALILSHLAKSMTVARYIRADVGGFELLNLTIDIALDPGLVTRFSSYFAPDGDLSYSESYISNPLLSRLIITKFHDNMFYYSADFSSSDRLLVVENTFNQILSLLPAPLLDLLGFNVDKSQLKYSLGDYFVWMSTGRPVGGFLTGSMIAESLVIFYWFLPLMILFSGWVYFIINDSLIRDNRIALLLSMQLGFVFNQGFSSESISDFVGMYLRGIPQNLVIYIIVYYFTKFICREFTQNEKK